jgi:dTDP-4-dehydrorhamnose reductase
MKKQKTSQNRQPLLTTGLNGLVGSKFAQIYQEQYQFDSLDIRHPTQPVDITDRDAVLQAVQQSAAQVLVHLAAFTNVTAAWQQRGDKSGLAYQVNVEGTKNIIQACRDYGKRLIHISTAYVFAGDKPDKYSEADQPEPIEWYGQTKWEAEQLIMGSELDWAILRIDQPFRSDSFSKPDIAHKIVAGLRTDSLHPMFDDHYFGPTYLDDFAHVLHYFINQDATGLFHATSGEKWSDFEFAQAIKKSLNLEGEIEKGNLDKYLQTLNRPYQRNTSLDCSKLKKELDFELTPIKEALKQVAES